MQNTFLMLSTALSQIIFQLKGQFPLVLVKVVDLSFSKSTDFLCFFLMQQQMAEMTTAIAIVSRIPAPIATATTSTVMSMLVGSSPPGISGMIMKVIMIINTLCKK